MRDGKASCPIDGAPLKKKAQHVHKPHLHSPPRIGHEDSATVYDFSVTGKRFEQLHTEPPQRLENVVCNLANSRKQKPPRHVNKQGTLFEL